VAYLVFPAPWDKVSLGTPTQLVRGSTDAKNEFGVKGRRKLRLGPKVSQQLNSGQLNYFMQ